MSMGKRKRHVADENSAVQGQKIDEPSEVMNDEVAKQNHKKKKKKRDKVDKNASHGYVDATGCVLKMVESPKKKHKRSHDKLNGEDASAEILESKVEDVKNAKKKKKHKYRDKVETPEPAIQNNDHSLDNEECHRKTKKKHKTELTQEEVPDVNSEDSKGSKKKKRKHREKTEESTFNKDIDKVQFQEMVVTPKKKKKRKHEKIEEITLSEDIEEVQLGETIVIPKKKKKKRKHDKTEETTANEDADQLQHEEKVAVPKKKKKRKHNKARFLMQDDSPLDEKNENVTVEKLSGDEDAIDMPEERSKDGKEAKVEVDDETRQTLKQDWQDKTSLKKLRMQQPKMFLIDNFTNDEDPKMTFKPVEVQDLQDLIQYSVMGNAANTNKVRFCKLVRPVLISKVAVIFLNGVTDEHFQKNRECFSHLNENYDVTGQILRLPSQQQESFLNQILNIEISKKQLKKRAYFARIQGVPSGQSSTGGPPKTTPLPARTAPLRARTPPSATPRRTHYLLSDDEKDMWRYPQADDPGYTHTKHSDTVGDKSPIISVDCEMCVTKKGSELTRVSLVDEKHHVLYNSLVKPHNPIIDYVTRYSGITKQLLDPVTVRLEDVQRDIIALLPSDAILVGQSLENDLRALKLYHPHVIDTSNLFTGSYRVALRKLAWKYLGVTIQEQETGHDSVEDAIVALKLLQLKMEKWSSLEKYTSNGSKKQGTEIIPTESMFRCAQSLGRVSMLIDSLSVAKQFMKDPVGAIPCQNDSEALKKTVQSVPYSDFVCVQFYNFSKLMQGISLEGDVVKETLKQLDQRIKKIYKTLPLNSFFLVIMATDQNNSSKKGSVVKELLAHGRFFTGLKVKY
ncbi:uncharacterized exonuclease C637.09-like [Patiria miniata]|uniref:Exonuclease domain-containing protein n=1 Tax=Patiria miniata TaxID=46514 RepID=A0A914B0U3_PATMI|nr:uncharacterized exonuclease C637.09-like [Patiria miniata]